MVWWPNSKHFTLTNQRIKIRVGVLSRRIDEIELYRIKDVFYSASFFERLWGIGNISLLSTQISSRRGRITGIRNAEDVREAIRAYVQAARTGRGVREVDYFRDPAGIDDTDLMDQ
ncbi:PH domain-containing protein [Acidocella sp.]|uniref:PH domain-containing protein n=1 Tax=Acidocella sp. TaxID=50710 RepID=UPI0038D0446F